MAELSERQQAILKLVVTEYISSAIPVASQGLLQSHKLGVSSATVRNDMSYLEELGYISHPHTSAGRVPTDKGYRYFVEWLMDDVSLPVQEQEKIRAQFQTVETDITEWTQAAASALAGLVHTASVVTLPAAPQCRLKHINLVSVQDSVVLLVVVLAEGAVRQQMLTMPQPVTEVETDAISHRLNALFKGRIADQISLNATAMSATENAVKEHLVKLMAQADTQKYQNAYFDGVLNMLSQPEFAQAERMRQIVELLHSRGLLSSILSEVITGEGVKVTIGQENSSESLQNVSLVLSRYGVGGDISGLIGVLGPTRMHYDRAITAVRYTCLIMNELMREYYSES
jgi:heat-inducible transcriptional repressor